MAKKMKFGSSPSGYSQKGFSKHSTSALHSNGTPITPASGANYSWNWKTDDEEEIVHPDKKNEVVYDISEHDKMSKEKPAEERRREGLKDDPGQVTPVEKPTSEKKEDTTGEDTTEDGKKKIDWKNVWKNVGQILNRAGQRYNDQDVGEANWLPNRVVNKDLEATPDSQNKQTNHKSDDVEIQVDPDKNMTNQNPTAETSTAGKIFLKKDGNPDHDKNLKNKPFGSKERKKYYDDQKLAYDKTVTCEGAGCAGL